jgi:hypothetical protein
MITQWLLKIFVWWIQIVLGQGSIAGCFERAGEPKLNSIQFTKRQGFVS